METSLISLSFGSNYANKIISLLNIHFQSLNLFGNWVMNLLFEIFDGTMKFFEVCGFESEVIEGKA